MTTREKFEKLAGYIFDNYDPAYERFTEIGKMTFYHSNTSYLSFQYFKVRVTVMNGMTRVELPDHIDFKDFNPVILLRDLWKEATENLPKPTVFNNVELTGDMTKVVTLQEVAEKFNVPVSNIRIKE